MKRFFILLVIICLLIPCFCFSASAESFDYMDYITNIQLLGDGYATVTVDLPVDGNRYDITDPLFADSTQTSFSQSVTYPFSSYDSSGYDYDIKISPSWSNKRVNALSLTNLPAKSELNIWLNIESYDAQSGEASTPTIDYEWYSSAGLWYYLKDGSRVKTQKTEFGLWSTSPIESDNNYTFQFFNTGILTDPENPTSNVFTSATSFYPSFSFSNVRFTSDTVLKLTVVKYQLILHLDESQLGDKYTKLLNSILNGIEEQGKQIDELTGAVTRIPVPQAPAGSELVGDILDSEGNLTGYAQSNLHVIDSYMNGIAGILADLSPALLATSTFLNKIINLEPVRSLFIIAVCVGLLGLVINLGAAAINFGLREEKAKAKAIEKREADLKSRLDALAAQSRAASERFRNRKSR